MTDENQATHFGYQTIKSDEKNAKVAEVFHSVAQRYDLMNDLMSLGIHRIWKKFAIERTQLRPGAVALDLAGGTGDLTKQMAALVGKEGRVFLGDINNSMLQVGREKLINEAVVGNINYVQLNAENLPFSDNSFDCITIAFGLRNVTHIDKALASMYRTVKPGGNVLILEFSKPTLPGLKKIYDLYSFSILPMLGKAIVDDAASYRYLAESIRMHPDQETLKNKMEIAGFEQCEYFNLSGGIVALHRGVKF